MELPWVDHTDVLARIGRSRPMTLQLAQPDQGERRMALEAFIHQRFAEHYGAHVKHFMPCLLGLHDEDGTVQGAVGLRSARRRPLFLERYLTHRSKRRSACAAAGRSPARRSSRSATWPPSAMPRHAC